MKVFIPALMIFVAFWLMIMVAIGKAAFLCLFGDLCG